MDIWIASLVVTSAVLLGLFLMDLSAARQRRLDQMLGREVAWQEEEGVGGAGVRQWLARVGARLAGAEGLGQAAQKLKWAGLSVRPEEFYGIRLGAALVAGGAALSMSFVGMGPMGVGLAVAAAAIGFLAPDMWLTARVTARRRAVERQLLGFVDMLAVATEAGLNLGDALQYVAERMGGLLGKEVQRAGSEVRLGATRDQALPAVADRLGHPGLTRVVLEIVQAEKTGTPVVEILRRQASLIREERRLKAQELAQKASVKLMLPVILFIFMPTMVLIMSPAVVNVLKVLR